MSSNVILKPTPELETRRRAVYVRCLTDSSALPSILELVNAAKQHPRHTCVVDFAAKTRLTSTDLEWLEQLSALTDANAIRLRVVCPSKSRVRHFLSLLQFDRFLVVVPSLKLALRFGK
jgi:Tfp pilus assembly protein PilN